LLAQAKNLRQNGLLILLIAMVTEPETDDMLTLAEIESTMQIDYELRLEALGEEALRALLADAAALRAQIPMHLSDADGRRIAEATLAELIASKTPAPQSAHPSAPLSAWTQLFKMLWTPFR
jgi:hypothetical protein